MKTIFSVLALLVMSTIAIAQSTLTIKAEGSRNKQVIVDNSKTYTISTTSADDQPIVITDLQPGQHTLSIVRTNQARNITTSFNLRQGYDLTLSIKANGSISTSEVRSGRGSTAGTQISTAAYNRLYTQTRNRTGASARTAFLEKEFTTNSRMFTSRQASQLIQLVNSESQRLKLSKLAYGKVVDRTDFSVVTNLLNSTASRNELSSYIASYSGSSGADNQPMTTAQFNIIYGEVVAENTYSERAFYLNNFFSRSYNYYTSAQAKQLIEVVANESDRLTLAKNAYRGITDKANYYNSIYSLLQSSSSRSQLSAYIINNGGTSTGTVQVAMSDAEFNSLYNNVRNSWSTASKLSLVTNAFNSTSNYFTSAQVRQLLFQVSSETDKLSLAKNAYANVVDIENFSQVYDVFTTSASRNDLAVYVNTMQGGTGTVAKIAMAETEYNSLYRSVQFTFGIGAKYSELTNIFNTETNYFTVAQAKKLVQLVSSESNRLELAKLSYNNITDQSNFSQMYDLFSQSNRNELIAYIGSASSQ